MWAEISLSALKNNLSVVRHAAPNTQIMAVIKSDAYGHGAAEAAKALVTADALAVARIDEAIRLRNHHIKNNIIVLSGINTLDDIELCIEQQLQPVIHSESCIQLLKNFSSPCLLKVWLKLDTGMHRLGLEPNYFNEALAIVTQVTNVELQGVISHLSDAEIITSSKNNEQLELFNTLCSNTSINTRSLSNSAGILLHQSMHFEWVRPGIMLYGINPSTIENTFSKQLKAVMSFKSRVINIRSIKAGEKVGYNGTWTANEPSTIATIAVGYGDGYPRHAKNGTPVYINGKNYPLAGRVSMDMITVNIGQDNNIKIGDEVILWGNELSAQIIADNAATIPYVLFCGITNRVQRIYSQ